MIDENLIANLQRGSDTQRRAASYQLAKSGNPEAVPYLIKAYYDSDFSVRRNVLDGLRNIATVEAVYFLNANEVEKQRLVEQVQKTGSIELTSELAASPALPTSPEALDHFEHAINMWKEATEDQWNDSLKRDIASELMLAIHKANAPFPAAHTLIAMLLNELQDDKRAAYHANKALYQNPNEFRAQLVKIDVEVKGVRIVNLQPGHFVELSGNWENVIGGTIGKTVGSLVAAGTAAITQANFKAEVEILVRIFRNVCKINTDVDEFLFMANVIINLGDFLIDSPLPGGLPNLYKEVANAPVETLNQAGQEREVADVRFKAEGRSLLFIS